MLAGFELSPTAPLDEIHYFQEPIRRQFRFATERQSDSSRVLAEGSAGYKHERSRSAGNAVVVIPAQGQRRGADAGLAAGGLLTAALRTGLANLSASGSP